MDDVRRRLARVRRDPRLLALQLARVVSAPFILAARLRRFYARGYEWEVNRDRWLWTVDAQPPEPGIHVVFVGAGFGEYAMISRVAKGLAEAAPTARISFCLRDPSTLAMVRAERPGTRASLWPFDALPPVLRWLGQERPDVVVFTERFRFPIFMGACAAFGARVSLINGRCRVREGPFYRLAASFYRWQFGLFSLMAMQSERYRQAATRWAPQAEVIVTGDIKGDLAPPNLGPDREAELRAWLRPETAPPIVVAGSTANLDEERLVLEAFRRLRAQTPARLLLAPRKLTRREEVLGLLHAEGFSVSPRTEPTGDAEVYLLDSLGELAWCYRYAEVAYVGGAMGAGAGHNVLEPLEWGLPVAYGMNRGHFEALQKLCEEAGVGTRVATAEAIADHWLKYLRDPAARDDAAIRGRTLVANNRGSIATTVKALHRLLVG